MSVAEWYIFAGNRQQGPFTTEQIRSFVDGGKLKPSMGMKKEGMADFVPASTVKGLFPQAAAALAPALEPAYEDEVEEVYEDEVEQVYEDEMIDKVPEEEVEKPGTSSTRRRRTSAGGDDEGASPRRRRRSAISADYEEGTGTARKSRRGAGAPARKGKRKSKGGKAAAGSTRRVRAVENDDQDEGGSKVLAIIGLVMAGLSLPGVWIPILNIGCILGGIIGFILAFIGRKSGGAIAKIAIILSIVVVVASIAINVWALTYAAEKANEFGIAASGFVKEIEENGITIEIEDVDAESTSDEPISE